MRGGVIGPDQQDIVRGKVRGGVIGPDLLPTCVCVSLLKTPHCMGERGTSLLWPIPFLPPTRLEWDITSN